MPGKTIQALEKRASYEEGLYDGDVRGLIKFESIKVALETELSHYEKVPDIAVGSRSDLGREVAR